MHFRGILPAPRFNLGHRLITSSDTWLRWSSWVWCWIQSCIGLLTSRISAHDDFRVCNFSPASRTTCGEDHTTFLRVYRSLIRSLLDYGCQIYRSTTGTCLKTLDSIHHRALRLSTGAFRSSSALCLYLGTSEPFPAVLPHWNISGTSFQLHPQHEFIVYSDSQSALQSICNSFYLHPIVREIHRWLRLLNTRGKFAKFSWVQEHVGWSGHQNLMIKGPPHYCENCLVSLTVRT